LVIEFAWLFCLRGVLEPDEKAGILLCDIHWDFETPF